MPFSTYAGNSILDRILRNAAFAVATPYVSLHTANPGLAGGSEVAGGAGPYARQLGTFDAAAAKATQNSAIIDFAGMPAVTVTHVGLWDALAAGNFLWYGPLTDGVVATFTALASSDVFTSYAHGLSDTNQVELVASPGSALPTGVVEGVIYFVRDTTADTFKLALTSGGVAINITTDGEGIAFRLVPKTTNAGDTVRIPAADLDFRT